MGSHKSVLLEEVVNGLDVKPNSVVVDLTLGRAGHAKVLFEKINNGHLYGFDQDIVALKEGNDVLKEVRSNYTLIHSNFRNFSEELAKRGVNGVDAILLDLGVSSPQFDEGARGFSYRFDAELDMRMDQENNPLTAKYIVNHYPEAKLKELFYKYAEHPFSKQIAHKIVFERALRPINTTFELVEIIKSALPLKELRKKGHPAKTIFQALRIEVNNELGVLEEVLEKAPAMLNVKGRLAIITFHSLEDRLVKQKFKSLTTPKTLHPLALPTPDDEPEFILVNKKPITSSPEELSENPRASSAKLRIIERRRK